MLQSIKTKQAPSDDQREFRHAFKEEMCSFDASITLDSLDAYSSLDDKMAFLELNLRTFNGFLGIEYNKIDRQIITKNHTYNGMLIMVRQFNHHFATNFWKLHPKHYYKY